MREFLQVDCDGKRMLINVKHIVVIRPNGAGCEIIVSATKNNENLTYHAKESYEHVMDSIEFLLG